MERAATRQLSVDKCLAIFVWSTLAIIQYFNFWNDDTTSYEEIDEIGSDGKLRKRLKPKSRRKGSGSFRSRGSKMPDGKELYDDDEDQDQDSSGYGSEDGKKTYRRPPRRRTSSLAGKPRVSPRTSFDRGTQAPLSQKPEGKSQLNAPPIATKEAPPKPTTKMSPGDDFNTARRGTSRLTFLNQPKVEEFSSEPMYQGGIVSQSQAPPIGRVTASRQRISMGRVPSGRLPRVASKGKKGKDEVAQTTSDFRPKDIATAKVSDEILTPGQVKTSTSGAGKSSKVVLVTPEESKALRSSVQEPKAVRSAPLPSIVKQDKERKPITTENVKQVKEESQQIPSSSSSKPKTEKPVELKQKLSKEKETKTIGTAPAETVVSSPAVPVKSVVTPVSDDKAVLKEKDKIEEKIKQVPQKHSQQVKEDLSRASPKAITPKFEEVKEKKDNMEQKETKSATTTTKDLSKPLSKPTIEEKTSKFTPTSSTPKDSEILKEKKDKVEQKEAKSTTTTQDIAKPLSAKPTIEDKDSKITSTSTTPKPKSEEVKKEMRDKVEQKETKSTTTTQDVKPLTVKPVVQDKASKTTSASIAPKSKSEEVEKEMRDDVEQKETKSTTTQDIAKPLAVKPIVQDKVSKTTSASTTPKSKSEEVKKEMRDKVEQKETKSTTTTQDLKPLAVKPVVQDKASKTTSASITPKSKSEEVKKEMREKVEQKETKSTTTTQDVAKPLAVKPAVQDKVSKTTSASTTPKSKNEEVKVKEDKIEHKDAKSAGTMVENIPKPLHSKDIPREDEKGLSKIPMPKSKSEEVKSLPYQKGKIEEREVKSELPSKHDVSKPESKSISHKPMVEEKVTKTPSKTKISIPKDTKSAATTISEENKVKTSLQQPIVEDKVSKLSSKIPTSKSKSEDVKEMKHKLDEKDSKLQKDATKTPDLPKSVQLSPFKRSIEEPKEKPEKIQTKKTKSATTTTRDRSQSKDKQKTHKKDSKTPFDKYSSKTLSPNVSELVDKSCIICKAPTQTDKKSKQKEKRTPSESTSMKTVTTLMAPKPIDEQQSRVMTPLKEDVIKKPSTTPKKLPKSIKSEPTYISPTKVVEPPRIVHPMKEREEIVKKEKPSKIPKPKRDRKYTPKKLVDDRSTSPWKTEDDETLRKKIEKKDISMERKDKKTGESEDERSKKQSHVPIPSFEKHMHQKSPVIEQKIKGLSEEVQDEKIKRPHHHTKGIFSSDSELSGGSEDLSWYLKHPYEKKPKKSKREKKLKPRDKGIPSDSESSKPVLKEKKVKKGKEASGDTEVTKKKKVPKSIKDVSSDRDGEKAILESKKSKKEKQVLHYNEEKKKKTLPKSDKEVTSDTEGGKQVLIKKGVHKEKDIPSDIGTTRVKKVPKSVKESDFVVEKPELKQKKPKKEVSINDKTTKKIIPKSDMVITSDSESGKPILKEKQVKMEKKPSSDTDTRKQRTARSEKDITTDSEGSSVDKIITKHKRSKKARPSSAPSESEERNYDEKEKKMDSVKSPKEISPKSKGKEKGKEDKEKAEYFSAGIGDHRKTPKKEDKDSQHKSKKVLVQPVLEKQVDKTGPKTGKKVDLDQSSDTDDHDDKWYKDVPIRAKPRTVKETKPTQDPIKEDIKKRGELKPHKEKKPVSYSDKKIAFEDTPHPVEKIAKEKVTKEKVAKEKSPKHKPKAEKVSDYLSRSDDDERYKNLPSKYLEPSTSKELPMKSSPKIEQKARKEIKEPVKENKKVTVAHRKPTEEVVTEKPRKRHKKDDYGEYDSFSSDTQDEVVEDDDWYRNIYPKQKSSKFRDHPTEHFHKKQLTQKEPKAKSIKSDKKTPEAHRKPIEDIANDKPRRHQKRGNREYLDSDRYSSDTHDEIAEDDEWYRRGLLGTFPEYKEPRHHKTSHPIQKLSIKQSPKPLKDKVERRSKYKDDSDTATEDYRKNPPTKDQRRSSDTKLLEPEIKKAHEKPSRKYRVLSKPTDGETTEEHDKFDHARSKKSPYKDYAGKSQLEKNKESFEKNERRAPPSSIEAKDEKRPHKPQRDTLPNDYEVKDKKQKPHKISKMAQNDLDSGTDDLGSEIIDSFKRRSRPTKEHMDKVPEKERKSKKFDKKSTDGLGFMERSPSPQPKALKAEKEHGAKREKIQKLDQRSKPSKDETIPHFEGHDTRKPRKRREIRDDSQETSGRDQSTYSRSPSDPRSMKPIEKKETKKIPKEVPFKPSKEHTVSRTVSKKNSRDHVTKREKDEMPMKGKDIEKREKRVKEDQRRPKHLSGWSHESEGELKTDHKSSAPKSKALKKQSSSTFHFDDFISDEDDDDDWYHQKLKGSGKKAPIGSKGGKRGKVSKVETSKEKDKDKDKAGTSGILQREKFMNKESPDEAGERNRPIKRRNDPLSSDTDGNRRGKKIRSKPVHTRDGTVSTTDQSPSDTERGKKDTRKRPFLGKRRSDRSPSSTEDDKKSKRKPPFWDRGSTKGGRSSDTESDWRNAKKRSVVNKRSSRSDRSPSNTESEVNVGKNPFRSGRKSRDALSPSDTEQERKSYYPKGKRGRDVSNVSPSDTETDRKAPKKYSSRRSDKPRTQSDSRERKQRSESPSDTDQDKTWPREKRSSRYSPSESEPEKKRRSRSADSPSDTEKDRVGKKDKRKSRYLPSDTESEREKVMPRRYGDKNEYSPSDTETDRKDAVKQRRRSKSRDPRKPKDEYDKKDKHSVSKQRKPEKDSELEGDYRGNKPKHRDQYDSRSRRKRDEKARESIEKKIKKKDKGFEKRRRSSSRSSSRPRRNRSEIQEEKHKSRNKKEFHWLDLPTYPPSISSEESFSESDDEGLLEPILHWKQHFEEHDHTDKHAR